MGRILGDILSQKAKGRKCSTRKRRVRVCEAGKHTHNSKWGNSVRCHEDVAKAEG